MTSKGIGSARTKSPGSVDEVAVLGVTGRARDFQDEINGQRYMGSYFEQRDFDPLSSSQLFSSNGFITPTLHSPYNPGSYNIAIHDIQR